MRAWIEAAAIYVVIAGALAAGLVASYGRELEANRRPNLQWWLRRLLIMPVLAIIATAATEMFSLPASLAAFSAAMLSLGGYDALCLIERKWSRRLEALDQAKRRLSGRSDELQPRP